MKNIKFDCHAEVANIKVRTEGSKVENTQRPAIDLTMVAHVAADILPALLGCDDADAALLFAEPTDEHQNYKRYPLLNIMRSGAVFDNCIAEFDSIKFQAVKLTGISFALMADRVLDLHFKVSLAGLSDKSSGFLCGLFHETINFRIESAQSDLVDEAEK